MICVGISVIGNRPSCIGFSMDSASIVWSIDGGAAVHVCLGGIYVM